MIQVVKSDLIVGGVDTQASLIPERVFKVPMKTTKEVKNALPLGIYTMVVKELTSPMGVPLKVKAGDKVVGELVPYEYFQYLTFTVSEAVETFSFVNETEADISVADITMYPGELRNEKVNLIPKRCKEVKLADLEGWYLEVEFPLSDKPNLEQGYIILARTKSRGVQPFRIKDIEVQNKTVRFKAHHVFFDTHNMIVKDVRMSGSAPLILEVLNKSLDRQSPFKVGGTVEGEKEVEFTRVAYFDAIAGLVDQFNAKLEIDGWGFSIREDLGKDIGAELTYGKNIEEVKVFESWGQVVTKIYPVGPDDLTLPEEYLMSEVQYNQVYAKRVEFSLEAPAEVELEDGTKVPNTDQRLQELRTKATNYLVQAQYPKLAYTVTSNFNDDLDLWDTVHIKHPAVTSASPTDLDILNKDYTKLSIPIRVKGYEYDVISQRLISLQYGDFDSTLKGAFNKITEEAKKVVDKVIVDQEKKLEYQTELIQNLNKNGHVVIEDDAIYLVDKLPKEEAVNVWQLGNGGIGLSQNGINGNFVTAWDIEGNFSADVITAGTLEGSLLKIGSIMSDSLSLEAKEFIMNLTRGGGANLLRNSVMLSGDKFWQQDKGRWTPIRNTWTLTSVSENGFQSPTGSDKVHQTVNIPAQELYTLSFKLLKQTEGGEFKATIVPVDGDGVLGEPAVQWVKPAGEMFDGMVVVELPPTDDTTFQITFETTGTSTVQPVTLADVMLARGVNTFWQSADGEIYGVDVAFDADGLQIARRDPDSNTVIGKTVMTPYEFAGYVGDEKVFTLNEDITEVTGILVKEKGVFVPPIKIVQNHKNDITADIVWTGV